MIFNKFHPLSELSRLRRLRFTARRCGRRASVIFCARDFSLPQSRIEFGRIILTQKNRTEAFVIPLLPTQNELMAATPPCASGRVKARLANVQVIYLLQQSLPKFLYL